MIPVIFINHITAPDRLREVTHEKGVWAHSLRVCSLSWWQRMTVVFCSTVVGIYNTLHHSRSGKNELQLQVGPPIALKFYPQVSMSAAISHV